MQTLRVNNSRILRTKSAKFPGYYFYLKTNIQGDFQICISTFKLPFSSTLCSIILSSIFECFIISQTYLLILKCIFVIQLVKIFQCFSGNNQFVQTKDCPTICLKFKIYQAKGSFKRTSMGKNSTSVRVYLNFNMYLKRKLSWRAKPCKFQKDIAYEG